MKNRDNSRAPARGFTDAFWLQWHLTDDCNLSCHHCYRARGASGGERSLAELSDVLERYVRFLEKTSDDFRRKGRIQLCGGEPLLARNLLPIVEGARDAGIPCRVLSNGTLATPSLSRKLREAGVQIVQVSLDGDRDLHDELRGEGAFDQALRGIRHLAESELEVTVAATLSRANADQVANIIGVAVQAGAYRVAFSRLVPQGVGVALRDEVLEPAGWLSAQVTMIDEARRHGIALMPRDPSFTLLLTNVSPTEAAPTVVNGCAAGYNGLAIEPDGTVFPCRRLPIPLGNIFESDFDEIWSNPLLETLRHRDQLGGACGKCGLRWLCGGCRAVAYAMTGDMMAEDPQCPRRANAFKRAWSKLRQRWHDFAWKEF